mmetsp:Transcript_44680/g.137687  ORF Transcript_44680/g.137687 Transcript_44680/m.137687 type:complete len:200 (+) Transcript_44680:1303-1902(+)
MSEVVGLARLWDAPHEGRVDDAKGPALPAHLVESAHVGGGEVRSAAGGGEAISGVGCAGALWRDRDAVPQAPAEQHLRGCHRRLGRDARHGGVVEQPRAVGLAHPARRAERRVRLHGDPLGGAVVEQLPLRQQRVPLHLVHRRSDAARLEQLAQHRRRRVADADLARLARLATWPPLGHVLLALALAVAVRSQHRLQVL